MLSANTLFHFTKDKDTLLSILKSSFYPRLSLEQVDLFKGQAIAIPMCCFCDIPLSQISDHVSRYGSYAIGIKKEWAIKQGITPVMYFHKNSSAYKNVKRHISALKDLTKKGVIDEQVSVEQLLYVMYNCFFMKPYEGVGEEKIRYYDEREWRYVLPCFVDGKQTYLSSDGYNDPIKREEMNRSNEQYGIRFNPSVINYIIVKSEKEIIDVKHAVSSIKGNYPYDQVDLLTTRLISIERIKEDF